MELASYNKPGVGLDHMKIVDPDAAWGEDSWLNGDFSVAGPDFSPSMGNEPLIGTVSPSEIHMHQQSPAGFASPYSTFDSPSEGYDTSPLFQADDVTGPEEWYSLFPDATADRDRVRQDTVQTENSSGECASPTSTSSTGTSPRVRSSSGGVKRSSTSGVRKSTKPLPPIVVQDPNDTIAVKRARNTLAARKSRAKKAEKVEIMEAEIQDLKAQVEYWKNKYNAGQRS